MLFSYVPFGVTVMVLGCPDYLHPVQDPNYLFHLDNVPAKKIMETLGLN